MNINEKKQRETFLTTHCFGNKASEALHNISVKYEDIVDIRLSTADHGFLMVILTDNADECAPQIDAFIAQYKGNIEHTLVLDLQCSSHASEYTERWERYNVLSTEYNTLEGSLQSFFLFVEENLDMRSMIGFDWRDFSFMLTLSVGVACGTFPLKAG